MMKIKKFFKIVSNCDVKFWPLEEDFPSAF